MSIAGGPTRVLILDDVPADAALVERELRRGGFDVITLWVETEPEFVAALADFKPDIVLSDYSLPSFNGMDALQLVQQHSPTTPLIIVTGSLTEETAAECIKAGAADYVLKERLARLLPAVRGALERQRLGEDKRRAEEALRESEERYRLIFDKGLDAVLLTAPDGRIFAANPAACRMFGREANEICDLGRGGILDEADPRLAAGVETRARTGSFSGELTGLRSDGTRFPIELSTSLFEDRAGNLRTSMIIRDISEHRRAAAALLESENQLRTMFELASIGIAQADPRTGRWLRVNQKMCAITGYTAEELMALQIREITHPDDRQEDWEAFQRVVNGEAADYRMEKRYLRKDGSVIWVNVNMTVIRGEDGRPIRTVATIEDISERRRADEDLRNSKQLIVGILDAIPVRVFWKDNNLVYLGCNAVFARDAGFADPLDLIGKDDYQMGWRDQAELYRDDDRQVIESGCSKLLREEPQTTPEGNTITLLTSKVPLRDSSGEVSGVLGTYMEITEYKRAEEALRESEARFKAAFASSPIGMALVAPDGRYLEVNAALCQILGFSEEEVLARTFQDLTHPDDLDLDLAHVHQLLAGEISTYTMEKRYLHQQGHVVWVLLSVALVRDRAGQPLYFVSQVQDVTERKLAAQALRTSEERFRLIAENTADVIWTLDLATRRFTYVSPSIERLRGFTPEEVLAHPFEFSLTPDSLVRVEAYLATALAALAAGDQSARSLTMEVDQPTKKGGAVRSEIVASALTDASGRVTGVLGVTRDLTERQRGEQALRLRDSALAATANAVVITDSDLRIEWANPAFTQLTGYDLEEVRGQNQRFQSGVQDAAFYEELQRIIQSGSVWHGELVNRRKDGTVYSEEMTITPVRGTSGTITHFIAIRQDITERKTLGEQLRQSQKMEAVGQLAGGVAHDFNNLLQAMLSLTQMLVAHRSDPSRLETDAGELEQLVKRGAGLTQQLLLFSRRETLRPERLDLNDIVRDGLTLLHRLLKANVAIEVRLTEARLPVEGDRGQLGQVLLNLAVNASDAMPDGGRLLIETGSEAESVWVKVADTGGGIPAAIRDHIFEPFFTTKALGKGTGLGLSVVHGIVTRHGGTVTLESREGEGTMFSVTLPRAGSGESPPVVIAERSGAAPRGNGERVLVVEDEETARQALSAILTMLGYIVTAVGSGEEAGKLAPEQPFDLLLTDLMLPGIAGGELAIGLQARWPDLRVVLMSGYAEDEAVRLASQAGTVRFLQKPFDMDTLARELRAALHPA